MVRRQRAAAGDTAVSARRDACKREIRFRCAPLLMIIDLILSPAMIRRHRRLFDAADAALYART